MTAKKKKAEKKVKFPTLVYGIQYEDFDDTVTDYTDADGINGYLDEGKPTLVAIYEFVGTETRTKRVVVDVDDVA